MRIGDFEVRVKPQNREPFYEVQDPQDGSVYVVACPGSLFEIQVSASPHLRGGRMLMVRCEVDGKNVGHCTILDQMTPKTKFVGFVEEGDSRSITYDRFKFAVAVAEKTEAESVDFKEGRIRITFSEVRCAGYLEVPYEKPRDNKVGSSSKVPSLPEGKKFFLAPSLTTASGGSRTGSGFRNQKYTTASRFTWETIYLGP